MAYDYNKHAIRHESMGPIRACLHHFYNLNLEVTIASFTGILVMSCLVGHNSKTDCGKNHHSRSNAGNANLNMAMRTNAASNDLHTKEGGPPTRSERSPILEASRASRFNAQQVVRERSETNIANDSA
eukprot:706273-Pleurochrysis_carterae.AAC.4